jgi:predicted nucleotidyltransferase
MELASPLATLVSPGQASALRVLARTDAGMTGRQVSRVADMPNTGIQRALEKLERAGLVTVDRNLHASSYRVNRDHILWPALRLVLDAPRELDHRIVEFVERADVDIVSVAMFGSVARGESTSESDVDLAVVYGSTPSDDFSVALGSMVERWTGNDCQVFDVTRADVARMVAEHDPLVDSWRRDARTVFGADLRGLL